VQAIVEFVASEEGEEGEDEDEMPVYEEDGEQFGENHRVSAGGSIQAQQLGGSEVWGKEDR